MSIYVIARDFGYEGHSEPLQVFYDLACAQAAVRLAESACAYGLKIYHVPVWPDREPTREVAAETPKSDGTKQ